MPRNRRSVYRAVTTSLLALVAVMVVGCSDPPTRSDDTTAVPAVIGSDGTAASSVLAQVYAGALRRSGSSAEVAPPSAGRAAAVSALDDLSRTFYAGFSGDMLADLDPSSPATSADDVIAALNRSLPEWLSVADAASAQNSETVTATTEVASGLASATIGDLAPRCAELTASVSAASDADAVAAALKDKYGCVFADVRIDGSAVDVTITPALEQSAATGVALADSDDAFRAQNVVPLYRKGTLNEAATDALGIVAGELTTADLADMVDLVRRGSDAAAVADSWLQSRVF